MIPRGLSKALDQRRRDNRIAKRDDTKGVIKGLRSKKERQ
jgi:hypothetical protein